MGVKGHTVCWFDVSRRSYMYSVLYPSMLLLTSRRATKYMPSVLQVCAHTPLSDQ